MSLLVALTSLTVAPVTTANGPDAGTEPASVASTQAVSDAADRAQNLFEALAERAARLARSPYTPPPSVDERWHALDYDAHRDIRFRPDAALWRGERPYELQFFHLGFLFTEPVKIATVAPDGLTDLAAARAVVSATWPQGDAPPASDAALRLDGAAADGRPWFDFGPVARAALERLGLDPERDALPDPAGFRVHSHLHGTEHADEFLVFLGASYFRVVGRHQLYGLSARGVAIDTAQGPEEFPAFRAFWIVEPTASVDAEPAPPLDIVALLDGPSLTGAYHFRVHRDAPLATGIVIDVRARLFARRDLAGLGLAPLTSMFWFGDGEAGEHDDFRPAVHDSDRLVVVNHDGAWIQRPLTNPMAKRVTRLVDPAVRGFGLIQSTRDFDRYRDVEAGYHRRPSLWVEWLESPGAGGVELVEIPTPDETFDNIVAYWIGDEPLPAGASREVRYRLVPFEDLDDLTALATLGDAARPDWRLDRAAATHAGVPGDIDTPAARARRVLLDFCHPGGHDSAIESLSARVIATVRPDGHRLRDARIERLPARDDCAGLRVSFIADSDQALPPGGLFADVQVWLERDGRRVSDVWSSPVTAP